MNMHDFIRDIIKTLSIGGPLIVILAYLAKSYVDKLIQIDHKKLESNLNQQVESLKSSLERQNLKIQIAYSGFYEKQITVLISVYNLAYELIEKLNDVIHDGVYATNYNAFTTVKNDFEIFLDKNLIFIDANLQTKISNILNKAWEADFRIAGHTFSASIQTYTTPQPLPANYVMLLKDKIAELNELKKDLASHTQDILNAKF